MESAIRCNIYLPFLWHINHSLHWRLHLRLMLLRLTVSLRLPSLSLYPWSPGNQNKRLDSSISNFLTATPTNRSDVCSLFLAVSLPGPHWRLHFRCHWPPGNQPTAVAGSILLEPRRGGSPPFGSQAVCQVQRSALLVRHYPRQCEYFSCLQYHGTLERCLTGSSGARLWKTIEAIVKFLKGPSQSDGLL